MQYTLVMEFFNYLTSQLKAFVLAMLMFAQVLVGALSAHSSVVVSAPALPQHVASTSPPSLITSTTTSKTAAKPAATKTIVKTTTVVTSTQNITKAAAPSPSQSLGIRVPLPTEQLNAQTRASLVNILCTTKAGGSFNPISGSGVIIDTRGVILTNAHVGQFFLLQNYSSPGNIQCVVRTGSPATPTYTATLLYLPPPWVAANAAQITSEQAMGTGENDYSFLLIMGTVSSNIPLPTSFPALPMTSDSPSVSEPVFLAAYPAGFLGGVTIQSNLYASSALSTVEELYTFDDPHNIDLVALEGSVVAQSGSSGGAVIDAQSGKLMGLIATETTGTTTSSRLLNAITIAHINRSLTSLGKGGIVGLLSGDIVQKASDFQANTAPSEAEELEAVLNKTSH